MNQLQDIVTYETDTDSSLIICKFQRTAFINLDLALQIVEDRIRISKNEDRLCLVYPPSSVTVTKDARLYMFKKESRKCARAMALVQDNTQQFKAHFMNLLFKLLIRDTALKVVKNEEEGLNWLLKIQSR